MLVSPPFIICGLKRTASKSDLSFSPCDVYRRHAREFAYQALPPFLRATLKTREWPGDEARLQLGHGQNFIAGNLAEVLNLANWRSSSRNYRSVPGKRPCTTFQGACHATNDPPYRWSPRTTYVAIGSPPGLLMLPQVVPLGQLVPW